MSATLYFMKPTRPLGLLGVMHTASGLKMALPQSGTERLVAGSSSSASWCVWAILCLCLPDGWVPYWT